MKTKKAKVVYRRLRIGEKTRKGDQFLNVADGAWYTTKHPDMIVLDVCYYRRRITPERK